MNFNTVNSQTNMRSAFGLYGPMALNNPLLNSNWGQMSGMAMGINSSSPLQQGPAQNFGFLPAQKTAPGPTGGMIQPTSVIKVADDSYMRKRFLFNQGRNPSQKIMTPSIKDARYPWFATGATNPTIYGN